MSEAGTAVPVPIRICGWSARYRDAFRELNEEWLRRYFEIEPIDVRVLADPERYILKSGGQILLALDGAGRPIGTCALKPDGDDALELTKMAVTQRAQGHGVGRQLLSAAIDAFRDSQASRLFLESHSTLQAALHLYEQAGFRHQPRPAPSEYLRADVYMVWQPPPDSG